MKYLSILLIGIALYWSWGLIHEPSDITQEEHLAVQTRLQEKLYELIEKHFPAHEEFQWEKMYTEKVGRNRMEAHFRYSFEEVDATVGPTRVAKEGVIHLERVKNEQDESIWEFTSLSDSFPEVEFHEPIRIVGTLDGEDTEEDSPPSDTNESE